MQVSKNKTGKLRNDRIFPSQELPHFVIYNLWNSLKDNEMQ